MYRLTARIDIRDSVNKKIWKIYHVQSIEIKEDLDIMTDVAKIELSKRIKWDGENSVPKLQNCEVVINLGYNDRIEEAFIGIIRSVQANESIILYCESEITKYKEIETELRTYGDKTLKEILENQGVKEEIDCRVSDRPINFTVYSGSIYGIMQKLQGQGLIIKLLNEKGKKKLFISRYIVARKSEKKYRFDRNIIKGVQEKDLEYRSNFGGIITIQNDGYKRNIIKFGIHGIDQTKIRMWNRKEDKTMWDEVDKILRTKRDVKEYYKPARIITFGGELCRMLDEVEVTWLGQRGDILGKKGRYIATKITTKFGFDGFRQIIKFGVRQNEENGTYFG